MTLVIFDIVVKRSMPVNINMAEDGVMISNISIIVVNKVKMLDLIDTYDFVCTSVTRAWSNLLASLWTTRRI